MMLILGALQDFLETLNKVPSFLWTAFGMLLMWGARWLWNYHKKDVDTEARAFELRQKREAYDAQKFDEILANLMKAEKQLDEKDLIIDKLKQQNREDKIRIHQLMAEVNIIKTTRCSY